MQRPTEWIEQHRTLRAIVAFPSSERSPGASPSSPSSSWFLCLATLLFAGYLEGFGAHLRGVPAWGVVFFGLLASALVLVASVFAATVVGAVNGCFA